MPKYQVTSSDLVEERRTWIIECESEDEAQDIAEDSEPQSVKMLYLEVQTEWDTEQLVTVPDE
tara:strand:- start:494 stop:682 length:189 start_codon:yes stop_codon:yes gene_type:complete